MERRLRVGLSNLGGGGGRGTEGTQSCRTAIRLLEDASQRRTRAVGKGREGGYLQRPRVKLSFN